jgi:AraC family transcriptional regulator, ethanolamine operon transcriptional activator
MSGHSEPLPQLPLLNVAAGTERFELFEHLAAFYTGWNIQVEQRSEGKFSGAVKLARTPRLYVVEGSFSQSISVLGDSNANDYCFYFVEPASSKAHWWGRRLESQGIVALGPNTPAAYINGRNTKTLGIAFDRGFLSDGMHSLVGQRNCFDREGWSFSQPRLELTSRAARTLRQFLTDTSKDPTLLGTAEGLMREEACLMSMLEALLPSEQLSGEKLAIDVRVRLTNTAEELMRSSLCQPLSAVEIATTLDVNSRTLRKAFKDRYGIGPTIYYKLLRLNAVRSRLRSTAADESTIAQVAREFSFHHLGNFASDYVRLFGELPSMTKRKR